MNTVMYNVDVLVVGGGVTGAMAAICAARSGQRVILIEKESYIGGMAVGSMMGQLVGCGLDGTPMFGGTSEEIVNKLIASGDAEYYPMRARTRPGNILLLRYSIESLQYQLESDVTDAGATILYKTIVSSIREDAEGCTVVARGLYDMMEIRCSAVIDATGNAAVAHLLGHDTEISPTDKRFPVSLIFKLGNVDLEKLKGFDWVAVRKEWFEKGILPAERLALAPCPNTNEAIVNATHAVSVNHESTEDVSKALTALRRQVIELIPVLKAKIPGLENAFLSAIAPVLGVRDARRIVGKYRLTGDDVRTMRDFDDAVAPSCWPMDVDLPDGSNIWEETDRPYRIPYRVMVPERGGRLLVTGRSIDADALAFSAVRVIPTCMGLGEAAGEAAAISVSSGLPFEKIDGKHLRNILVQKGVKL